MAEKHKTSHQLTTEATELLALMAQDLGISQAAILEIAIREKAEERGLRGSRPVVENTQEETFPTASEVGRCHGQ